jgi:farnesyl diphosphate synthase
VPPDIQARCVGLLARASGYWGMAGGQAVDLASVGQQLTEDQLRQMHRLKTGALLLCSVQLGGACAPSVPAATWQALERFGQALGLAFQVVDDVLDVTGDAATLGKTAGKDAAADKPTYVALMGLDAARRHADELAQQAMQALAESGLSDPSLQALRALTAMVVQRQH